jgi:Domain of unknown function (DUF4192)
MNSSTTLRVSTPEDLLALIPWVLGFHPEESLVLVVVSGGGGNLHARVDLPLDEDEAEVAFASLRQAVCNARARQVALVAYTDDAARAFDVTDRLTAELELDDVHVLGAVRADGERWYSLDCDPDCCPAEGQPYDLSTHPFTAEAVLDGQVTYSDRQALADSILPVDPDAVDAVAEAADDARRRAVAAGRHPLGMDDPDGGRRHLVGEGEWVRWRIRRHVTHGEPLDDLEAGRLVAAVADIEVRDVAWAEMTRASAEAHVELWREVVRRTPMHLLAAPAALLAFAAWLAGDGALAWCAVERCQEAQPDYSMAELIGRALTRAVPPSSWEPIPTQELTLFAS